MRYAATAAVGDADRGLQPDSEDWGFCVEGEIENMNRSYRMQNISGPFSPIALKFHPFTQSGMTK